jgi:hypothetical protein
MTANNRQVGGTHYAASIQHWDFCVQVLGNRYLEGNATKYLSLWRKRRWWPGAWAGTLRWTPRVAPC